MKEIVEKIKIIKQKSRNSLNEYISVCHDIDNLEKKIISKKKKCREHIDNILNTYNANIILFNRMVQL